MASKRTSQTHPLQIAAVRASPAHGRIGITFCPGKHDNMAGTGAWARDLATDLDAVVGWGAKLVLTLMEPAEMRSLKVLALGSEVLQRGLAWCHLPIADFSVPGVRFEAQWQRYGPEIRRLLCSGADVLVHCKGGLGRAGMMAARLLVELGMTPDAAIVAVRRARPGAIETPAQLALVRRTLMITAEDASREILDTTALQPVGGQLGSNPAAIYQDVHGCRYYVKSLESAALARNEIIAAHLYQLAGAPTLNYVRPSQARQVATEWMQLDKKNIAQFNPAERRQAQHWLGVHAWTANWDAAGALGDNQGVSDGIVLTLDVGGALAFRAMGDPKGPAFGTRVGELDTLRRDADNPAARKLFGDMGETDVAAAIRVVTRIPDAAICRVIADHGGSPTLAEKMVARKADMARRYG